MPHNLLPSKTVCERLNIDRSTLSRWVATGKIVTATQLPGKTGAFLFDAAEVARLESNERVA